MIGIHLLLILGAAWPQEPAEKPPTETFRDLLRRGVALRCGNSTDTTPLLKTPQFDRFIERCDLVGAIAVTLERNDFEWARIPGEEDDELRARIAHNCTLILGIYSQEYGDPRAAQYLIEASLDPARPATERREALTNVCFKYSASMPAYYAEVLRRSPDIAGPLLSALSATRHNAIAPTRNLYTPEVRAALHAYRDRKSAGGHEDPWLEDLIDELDDAVAPVPPKSSGSARPASAPSDRPSPRPGRASAPESCPTILLGLAAGAALLAFVLCTLFRRRGPAIAFGAMLAICLSLLASNPLVPSRGGSGPTPDSAASLPEPDLPVSAPSDPGSATPPTARAKNRRPRPPAPIQIIEVPRFTVDVDPWTDPQGRLQTELTLGTGHYVELTVRAMVGGESQGGVWFEPTIVSGGGFVKQLDGYLSRSNSKGIARFGFTCARTPGTTVLDFWPKYAERGRPARFTIHTVAVGATLALERVAERSGYAVRLRLSPPVPGAIFKLYERDDAGGAEITEPARMRLSWGASNFTDERGERLVPLTFTSAARGTLRLAVSLWPLSDDDGKFVEAFLDIDADRLSPPPMRGR